jgi:hypothetical protein
MVLILLLNQRFGLSLLRTLAKNGRAGAGEEHEHPQNVRGFARKRSHNLSVSERTWGAACDGQIAAQIISTSAL